MNKLNLYIHRKKPKLFIILYNPSKRIITETLSIKHNFYLLIWFLENTINV